jgi:hypothetical protein
MAIQFQAMSISPASTSTSGPPLSVPRPSGTANGDLILLQVWSFVAANSTSLSGWNALSTGGGDRHSLYYRVANNEPTSWSVGGGSGSGAEYMAIALRYSGTDVVNPIRAYGQVAGGFSSTSPQPANLAGVGADDVTVIFYGTMFDKGIPIGLPDLSTPGGWTKRADKSGIGASFDARVIAVDKAAGVDRPTSSSTAAGFSWGVASVALAAPSGDSGGFFF